MRRARKRAGFTLIELSIVLVIIGLIVGGILVGQDLIKAAEVRAQLSQIEKYNQAVNTFRGKFGGLPGDLAVSAANQFGFTLGSGCTGGQGGRDGNGLLDGLAGNSSNYYYLYQGEGEVALFWADLSSSVASNLIDMSVTASIFCGAGGGAPNLNLTPGSTYLGDYFPVAKIGHGNWIYVYENNGYNWYGVWAITFTNQYGCMNNWSMPASIPVIQAYNMDKKIDDGLPTTGAVVAQGIECTSSMGIANAANAATDNTATCYNTTTNTYSTSSYASYGAYGNCGLSFRFQ